MVAVALLLPPALLCLVLALDQYEERLLKKGSAVPRHALPRRHLRAVPGPSTREPPPGAGPAAGPATPPGRDAA
ncbi:hypothetical protein [Streptomyces cinnamoneus]|uniref:hypothetical protein n=1 Tax=Streptomyces cinnamoneus TaxID=53446 RepID=UPI00167D4926|nr:hypothetical protein [Streptomyces cinnamoneus]